MTVREIKKEAKERFTAYRFKAMPAYSMVFFVMVNIVILTALLVSLTVSIDKIPFLVSVLIWGYCGLLLLMALCLSGPFSFSLHEYFMRVFVSNKPNEAFAFGGFKEGNFARALFARLLKVVFMLLLTCLFIIPGLVFSIKTSLTFYELNVNPKSSALAAMKASSVRMKKHGALYFKLRLSFIGWLLFCVLTLGLGFIYVLPYWGACKVIFYRREVCKAGSNFVSKEPQESDKDMPQAMYAEVAPEESEYAETIVVSDDDARMSADEPVVEEAPVVCESQPAETVTVISVDEPAEPTSGTVLSVPQEQKAAATEQVASSAPTEAAEGEHDAESEKNATKEAIRQRIEQLKRERSHHGARPQKPEPKPPERPPVEDKSAETKHTIKPADASKFNEQRTKNSSDEFGPEVIAVELVEDE